MPERAQLPDDPGVTPDLPDVLQQDPPIPAVPVRHDGPIATHELPCRSVAMRSIMLTIEPEIIAGADPRRKRVTLLSKDDPFFVGTDQNSVRQGNASRWPILLPLPLQHSEALWARADANPTLLTVIIENWAD